MVTPFFAVLLLVSIGVALRDWRQGWLAVILCGILQDPVRKLIPGTPPWVMGSVVAVYAAVLFSAVPALKLGRVDFARRFSNLSASVGALVAVLVLAGLNGLVTFGVAAWRIPAFSLMTYLLPVAAILLGYCWLVDERQLIRMFKFYCIITSIAMIGTVAEHLRVDSSVLGLVGMRVDYIRHLPGIQVRMLSGIYRGPDIMAWHAVMLTAFAATLALWTRSLTRAWPWLALTAWGFINCLISGRRKALYMVAVFLVVLLLRYVRRLNATQLGLVIALAVILGLVVQEVSSSPETEVYAMAAGTSRREVLQRFEGGVFETLRQSSALGAGLGSATQGVRHVSGGQSDFGWQEGGLGKITAELGLPGLAVAILISLTALRLTLLIAAQGDHPGTSQLIRAALLAMLVANAANYVAAAQAYVDPLIAMFTAFLVGNLFATASLDERFEAAAGVQTASPDQPARPALQS